MKPRKNQLIFILGILLLSGFIATSLGSYFVSRASLRAQISRNELPITSDNIYSEIQRDLLRPIFISSLMASDTFLRDWVIQGEENATKITKYLKEIQDKYNTFTCFFVSEKTGRYYQSNGILKKVSPTEERDIWYYRVRDMQQDFEINVDPDMANKDAMTIFINYRVFDYDGEYIGATGVGLTVNAVKKIIDTYQKKYDRNIYFIDTSGVITLHGDSFSGESPSIQGLTGISSLADTILGSQDCSLKYRKDRKTVYVNTRYISEFDWILIVEQTDEKATRNILKTLFINLLICFAITTVVLILTSLTISVYQKQLEKMATTDKLTGLLNRHALDVMLRQSTKEAQRKKTPVSLVLLDIDHFKKINDSHGHVQGDAVIAAVADICRNSIRESDVTCRWGGEEFIILLKDCDWRDATNMANKIRVFIERNPIRCGNKTIHVTASLGVAQYDGKENVDEMLGRVDSAMYKAKQNGRNRVESCES